MCSIFNCVYVYFKHEEKDKEKSKHTNDNAGHTELPMKSLSTKEIFMSFADHIEQVMITQRIVQIGLQTDRCFKCRLFFYNLVQRTQNKIKGHKNITEASKTIKTDKVFFTNKIREEIVIFFY